MISTNHYWPVSLVIIILMSLVTNSLDLLLKLSKKKKIDSKLQQSSKLFRRLQSLISNQTTMTR